MRMSLQRVEGVDFDYFGCHMKNNFDLLLEWYQGNCDGEWEHQFGFKIETLDNPGVAIHINVSGTKKEGHLFDTIECENPDNPDLDWYCCKLTDESVWLGACSINNVNNVLEIFLKWCEDEDFVNKNPGA